MSPPLALADSTDLNCGILAAASDAATSHGLLMSLAVQAEVPLRSGLADTPSQYGFTLLYAPKPLRKKMSVTSMQHLCLEDPFDTPTAEAAAARGTPTLLVGRVGPDACIWLNRFNLRPLHALMTSRCFLHQMCVPPPQLLANAAAAATRLGGVASFNGGAESGASQSHWHVHLLPCFAGDAGATPLQRLATGGELQTRGIRHRFIPLQRPSPAAAASAVRTYANAAAATLIDAVAAVAGVAYASADIVGDFKRVPEMELPPAAFSTPGRVVPVYARSFNWFIFPEGVLVVARAAAVWGPGRMSVNSLSLLGSYFCSSELQRDILESSGAMTVMDEVLAHEPSAP